MSGGTQFRPDFDPTRAELRKKLLGLTEFIPKGAQVVFFDYAVYRNVGDLLISKSVEEFFKFNDNKVIDCFAWQNHAAALDRHFPSDAIFVFQGGGNFGDLFSDHNKIRLKLLRAHKKQPAVILPQTLYYRSKSVLEDDARILSQVKNLHICLRDKVSYEIAAKHFDNELHAFPDTAHFLQDFFGNSPPGGGVLNFLRQDEASYSVTGVAGLPEDRSEFVDWPTFLSNFEKAGIRRFAQLHRLDARLGHSRLPYVLWKPFRERILWRAARLFLNSGAVLTNRLHGVIFAIICRRNVSIVETGYGKTSAYYESWLNGFDSVTLETPGVHEQGMAAIAKGRAVPGDDERK